MDSLSKEQRSLLMGKVKSQDTAPELFIRSLLHRAGFRFRLHAKNLPGKPDIVLPKYKTIIEIRGCFWHLHLNCSQARIPKTKSLWWKNKLETNAKRDQLHCKILLSQGWRIVVVWGCIFKKIPSAFKPYFSRHLLGILDSAIKNQNAKFTEIDRDLLFQNSSIVNRFISKE